MRFTKLLHGLENSFSSAPDPAVFLGCNNSRRGVGGAVRVKDVFFDGDPDIDSPVAPLDSLLRDDEGSSPVREPVIRSDQPERSSCVQEQPSMLCAGVDCLLRVHATVGVSTTGF